MFIYLHSYICIHVNESKVCLKLPSHILLRRAFFILCLSWPICTFWSIRFDKQEECCWIRAKVICLIFWVLTKKCNVLQNHPFNFVGWKLLVGIKCSAFTPTLVTWDQLLQYVLLWVAFEDHSEASAGLGMWWGEQGWACLVPLM